MGKARTINYAKKELVEIIEVDVSDPGFGEVTVEGLACGVCAWDVYVYHNGVDWPVWPGHEGVALTPSRPVEICSVSAKTRRSCSSRIEARRPPTSCGPRSATRPAKPTPTTP